MVAACGREAGAVDELHLAALGVVVEDEHVGAETGHARLDLTLHGPRGDRRVDRVTARLEDPHPRFRRERVARRDHPMLRDDGWPPAAAGRLGIVLRLRANERPEDHNER
jgi:hypothetical protein